MIHKIKLDASKPQTTTYEEFKIRLSSKQIKNLKTHLGIKNDVSAKTLLTAYLSQNLK